MRKTKFNKATSLAAAILLFVVFWGVNSIAAESSASADKWQYEFTIYGWLPSIDGTVKYDIPGTGGSVGVDASDILDALEFTFMGLFQARKNKLSFGVDFIYADFSNSRSTNINFSPGPGPGVPLSVSAGIGLEALAVTGTVGYDVVQTTKARMALIGGVRYLDVSTDLDITVNGPLPPTPPPAHLSGSKDFWDGIVGLKGVYMLTPNWYIPYYADIGAGDSKLTYQLYAGIGYMFSWGDIKLGYRYVEYKQDDDKLVQDLQLYGPQVGIGFRF